MRGPKAPMGVTILAYLGFVVALAFGLLGVVALAVSGASQAIAPALPVPFLPAGPLLGAALLAFAALLAATGWGLLRKRPWAWVAALFLVAVSAAGDIARVARRDAGGVAGVLVVAILVWYLLRPEVRAWFSGP